MFRLFKKKKPFQKVIEHKEWLLIGGETAFFIPRKEHGCGKSPFVTVRAPHNTVHYEKRKEGILVKRGLPIDRGTPFITIITIQ